MKRLLLLIIFISSLLSCQFNKEEKTTESKKYIQDGTGKQEVTNKIDSIKLKGIDISHHQANIDWTLLKQSAISFVFIKATGGLDYTDIEFHNNWNNAKQSGIKRGAYHFYYATDDPIKQAEFFVKTVLKLSDPVDLPPVLDLETHGIDSTISVEKYQEDVKNWIRTVEKHYKRKPIIYTSTNFANNYLKDDFFSAYHLWLAEYGTDIPLIPDTWQKAGWKFWQNSSSYTIKGIENSVDHSYFAGSLKDLRQL